MTETDGFLNTLLDPLSSFTVLYTTTPPSAVFQHAQAIKQPKPYMWQYDAEEPFPTVLHTDMKRDLRSYARQAGNGTTGSSVPLFEKYAFLSPGLSCPLRM